jgi:GNAT superfamily N-acetyltransferase
MPVAVEAITDPGERSRICDAITAVLPRWFGRPESNAAYVAGASQREAFAARVDGRACGLIVIEPHFLHTCNIWWLGVRPDRHRHGVGRALVEHVASMARSRGQRWLAVETMSPRSGSPEYEMTRRFYEALGFLPFVAFEPAPGDHMMWMLRSL